MTDGLSRTLASPGRGVRGASNLLCLWFYGNLIMVHLGGSLEAGLKLSNLDTKRKEKNVA